MQTLQGIAVSPGVAIGEALVIGREGFRIPRRFVTRDAVDDELQRLQAAFETAAAEIAQNREAITRQLGESYGAIFAAHLEMLRDRRLWKELEQLVRQRRYSPEFAVSLTLRRYAKAFRELDQGYFAERAQDLFDIEKGLLRGLLGRRREELDRLASPVVILAHDLTPGETARLDRNFVLGLATEIGGPGGHTGIIARGLEIPCVVGVGDFLTDVSGAERVVVDGDQGAVVLQPDEETVARYEHEAEEHRSLAVKLHALRDLPAVTADGVRIAIHGNIEFPHEVKSCIDRGAEGIGLYRTEFLYLNAETAPTEKEHFQAYRDVARAMENRPVVIRTLDLGADKMGRRRQTEEEQNPFLGLRSIRLSLRNIPLFRVQLRAILRASVEGDVRVLFPLIATLPELRQAKMVLADAMEDLEEQGEPFNRDIPVGMMVEVPSAVVLLDKFLPEVDFLSVGTNDLIQYGLAVDRGNRGVADLYQDSDPAVLRLIDLTMRAARKAEVPVSVCGQMGGSSAYTMLLLGLGVRRLSIPPGAIPEIKKICRTVQVRRCEEIARRALAMDSAREINVYVREELRKVAPELVLR